MCKSQYTPVALQLPPWASGDKHHSRERDEERYWWRLQEDKDYPKWKRIACIAIIDVINLIPYLLLSSFCIELFIFHVQISSIPIMIMETILATCFLILQCCCARSSPSGFCHFQPKSARKICVRLPTRKIHVVPHNCTEQPQNSSEKVKFPCHVP